MPAHKHAELMAQYAEDAKITDEPWLLWELTHRLIDDSSGRECTIWVACCGHPNWTPSIEYRRKRKMIRVNGIEVPAPERVAPENGTYYFVPSVEEFNDILKARWTCHELDYNRLDKGIVYLNEDDCRARAKAMLKYEEI